MSGVDVGCRILSMCEVFLMVTLGFFVAMLIRFVRCLLGSSRYGVYDDASCNDQISVCNRSRSLRFL